MPTDERHPLNLTKHHGLGNDFLVLLDPPGDADLPALARALCDRREGFGADGLLTATRTEGAAARMVLHNADGSRAEMSGNGIRCLGQALVDAGRAAEGEEIAVLTDAGRRGVTVGADDGSGLRQVRAAMGAAKVTDLEERRAEVDTGNPHVVLLVADPASEDLEALGAEMPDVNVEVVRVDDRNTVTMRVHERGAGITQACGTGSCAIVAATLAWGLTESTVTVHNPGGDLAVELRNDEAYLTGPAQRVGSLSWP